MLDTSRKTVGFRRLRVVQEPLIDQPGTSFYFEVNNVPVFCGGSNWFVLSDNLIRCCSLIVNVPLQDPDGAPFALRIERVVY